MKSVPYAPVVGSLLYAMVATRPDISHVVGVISRFIDNSPRKVWAYPIRTKDRVFSIFSDWIAMVKTKPVGN